MGCNCGQKQNLKYQVTTKGGSKTVVATLAEAQQLVRAQGGTFKAVQA